MEESEEKRIYIKPLPEKPKRSRKPKAAKAAIADDTSAIPQPEMTVSAMSEKPKNGKKSLSDKKMKALGKATHIKSEYIKLGKQIYNERLSGKAMAPAQTIDNGNSDVVKRIGELEGLISRLNERLDSVGRHESKKNADENMVQAAQSQPGNPTEVRQEAILIPRESYYEVERKARYKEKTIPNIEDRYDPPKPDVRTNYILF